MAVADVNENLIDQLRAVAAAADINNANSLVWPVQPTPATPARGDVASNILLAAVIASGPNWRAMDASDVAHAFRLADAFVAASQGGTP